MAESMTPSNETVRLKASDEKYSALFAASETPPAVRFVGTVSTANSAIILNPFLDAVHDAVVCAGAKVVTVDFSQFEFCNSSGFKSFIYWIGLIQKLPAESRYRLHFLVAPGRRWQKTSLLVLTCFATEIVEIA